MSQSRNGRSRSRYILGGGAVLVLIAGVAIWWFIFRDDAPAEVDNAAANAQLDADIAEVADAGEAPATNEFDGDIDGTWTVDSSIGEFTFESASGSFAGFRVDEELIGPGSVVAVGRTGEVTGSIDISGDELSAAVIDVDLTTLISDRRGERAPFREPSRPVGSRPPPSASPTRSRCRPAQPRGSSSRSPRSAT